MVTKFFLRPNSLAFINLAPTHVLIFPKGSCSKLTFVSQFSIAAEALGPTNVPYGPSLYKGRNPFQQQKQEEPQCYHLDQCKEKEDCDEEDNIVDGEKFTRVFDIAALRVPAKCSSILESRLRGHLLNWPRIPNIARVPGDEVEENMVSFLGDARNGNGNEEGDGGDVVRFSRRIYGLAEGDGERLSPVLYREKLAHEFNSRGFVKFRNLAKISRPKRKRKIEGGNGEERNGRKTKKCALVEVVEKEVGEDWKGLLGDDFKGGRKWKGSTRLLLLDERFAQSALEQLPQAIKARLHEAMKENPASTFELVRCKLTLFYDYWHMNEILEAVLPKGMIVPSAFETVGHIAHLNLRDEHLPFKRLIAKVVLDKNKPKIQTVVNKTDTIHNDYRTMQLEVLAGNCSLVTMVVESGLRFHVDLATVYWNSRLATERQRLLNVFTPNDVVCDVFSGVGPIAISAAKIVTRVYANDLNPHAVDYLERNCVLNKLERKIKVFNMDGRRFIDAMFKSEKAHSITQVVMNLPNNAVEYLDAFRGIWADGPKSGQFNLPTIHVYGFSKAEDPEFDFHERIRIALREVAVNVEMRRVRLVAPGKWMLCASFRLPLSVAYANMQ